MRPYPGIRAWRERERQEEVEESEEKQGEPELGLT